MNFSSRREVTMRTNRDEHARNPSIFFELSSIEILAKHIVDFREGRGLSQEAFADMCNLHRTYIGSIERYERNVSLKTLEAIAKAIGIPLFQLFIPMTSHSPPKNGGESSRVNGVNGTPPGVAIRGLRVKNGIAGESAV
jgi:ribosome-binding protein aMBF1 (putative translation factor)